MRPSSSSHDIRPAREHDTGAHLTTTHRSARRSGRRRPLSSALGWFSIGLGVAELVAPRRLAGSIGIGRDTRTLGAVRAMGLREIATGVGLLASRRRSPWLLLRVGGDILDLALLRRAMAAQRRERARLTTALSLVAGVAAIDALVARRSRQGERLTGAGPHAQMVTAVVTILRPPHEVYGFFRQLSNLPHFMKHVESVEETSENTSRWTMRGPAERMLTWDAEIVKERPGELLSWRSIPGGDIHGDGVVRFEVAPGGRGTEVHAKIRYRAPGGRLGAMINKIAKLFGREPGQQALFDLRRLKQVLETGDVARSDASIHRGMHAAQPSSQENVR